MRGLRGAAFSLIPLVSLVAGCDNGVSAPADAGADAGPTCSIQNTFPSYNQRKVDLLFVVDDSPAMATMDAKLATAFPMLGSLFAGLVDPQFNLHVAVVSASVGGGRFTDVPGCEAGGPGDRQGRFSHPANSGLLPGETFDSATADLVRGQAPQPVLALHMQRGRIIGPPDLASTPAWAKPIVAAALEVTQGEGARRGR